jgi:nucleotide-binding universal stress UspA family protein
MTILIGYVPTALGEAAFEHGLDEAASRGDDVVVLNSPRHGSTVDGHGKLVMGSDAQRLLLELDVTVLAVKPTR